MNGLGLRQTWKYNLSSLHSLVNGDDLDVAQLKGITEDDTADSTCHKSSEYIHHQKEKGIDANQTCMDRKGCGQ